MVDISDDTEVVSRRAEVTRVVRRRRWNDEEKARRSLPNRSRQVQ